MLVVQFPSLMMELEITVPQPHVAPGGCGCWFPPVLWFAMDTSLSCSSHPPRSAWTATPPSSFQDCMVSWTSSSLAPYIAQFTFTGSNTYFQTLIILSFTESGQKPLSQNQGFARGKKLEVSPSKPSLQLISKMFSTFAGKLCQGHFMTLHCNVSAFDWFKTWSIFRTPELHPSFSKSPHVHTEPLWLS